MAADKHVAELDKFLFFHGRLRERGILICHPGNAAAVPAVIRRAIDRHGIGRVLCPGKTGRLQHTYDALFERAFK